MPRVQITERVARVNENLKKHRWEERIGSLDFSKLPDY